MRHIGRVPHATMKRAAQRTALERWVAFKDSCSVISHSAQSETQRTQTAPVFCQCDVVAGQKILLPSEWSRRARRFKCFVRLTLFDFATKEFFGSQATTQQGSCSSGRKATSVNVDWSECKGSSVFFFSRLSASQARRIACVAEVILELDGGGGDATADGNGDRGGGSALQASNVLSGGWAFLPTFTSSAGGKPVLATLKLLDKSPRILLYPSVDEQAQERGALPRKQGALTLRLQALPACPDVVLTLLPEHALVVDSQVVPGLLGGSLPKSRVSRCRLTEPRRLHFRQPKIYVPATFEATLLTALDQQLKSQHRRDTKQFANAVLAGTSIKKRTLRFALHNGFQVLPLTTRAIGSGKKGRIKPKKAKSSRKQRPRGDSDSSGGDDDGTDSDTSDASGGASARTDGFWHSVEMQARSSKAVSQSGKPDILLRPRAGDAAFEVENYLPHDRMAIVILLEYEVHHRAPVMGEADGRSKQGAVEHIVVAATVLQDDLLNLSDDQQQRSMASEFGLVDVFHRSIEAEMVSPAPNLDRELGGLNVRTSAHFSGGGTPPPQARSYHDTFTPGILLGINFQRQPFAGDAQTVLEASFELDRDSIDQSSADESTSTSTSSSTSSSNSVGSSSTSSTSNSVGSSSSSVGTSRSSASSSSASRSTRGGGGGGGVGSSSSSSSSSSSASTRNTSRVDDTSSADDEGDESTSGGGSAEDSDGSGSSSTDSDPRDASREHNKSKTRKKKSEKLPRKPRSSPKRARPIRQQRVPTKYGVPSAIDDCSGSGLVERAMRLHLVRPGRMLPSSAPPTGKSHIQSTGNSRGDGSTVGQTVQKLSRAQAAKLTQRGFFGGDCSEPPLPLGHGGNTRSATQTVFTNATDSLLRHVITLQFAAVSPLPDSPFPLRSKEIYFSMSFFNCGTQRTPALRAVGAEWAELENVDALRAQFTDADGQDDGPRAWRRNLQRQPGGAAAVRKPPALQLTYAMHSPSSPDVPQCQFEVDTSVTSRSVSQLPRPDRSDAEADTTPVPQQAQQFARYLYDDSLEIEVWDNEAKIPLGSAYLPLRHLLRHKRREVSFGLELDVFPADFAPDVRVVAANEPGGGPCDIRVRTAAPIATIHLLGKNHGLPGRHHVDGGAHRAISHTEPQNDQAERATAPALRVRAERVVPHSAPSDRAATGQAVEADVTTLSHEEFRQLLRAFGLPNDGVVFSEIFTEFVDNATGTTSLMAKYSALRWLHQNADLVEESFSALKPSTQDGFAAPNAGVGHEEFIGLVDRLLHRGKADVSVREVRTQIALHVC